MINREITKYLDFILIALESNTLSRNCVSKKTIYIVMGVTLLKCNFCHCSSARQYYVQRTGYPNMPLIIWSFMVHSQAFFQNLENKLLWPHNFFFTLPVTGKSANIEYRIMLIWAGSLTCLSYLSTQHIWREGGSWDKYASINFAPLTSKLHEKQHLQAAKKQHVAGCSLGLINAIKNIFPVNEFTS